MRKTILSFRSLGLRLSALTLLIFGMSSAAFAQLTCASPSDLTPSATSDGTVTLSWVVDQDDDSVDDHVFTVVIGGTGLNCDNAATAGVLQLILDDTEFTAELTDDGVAVTYEFDGLAAGLVRGTSYRFIVRQTCNGMVMDEGDSTTGDCTESSIIFKIPETPFTIVKEAVSPTCFPGGLEDDDGRIIVTVEDGTCDDALYNISLEGGAITFFNVPGGAEVQFIGLESGDYTVVVEEVSGCFFEEDDNPMSMDITIDDPAAEPAAELSVFELFGMLLGEAQGEGTVDLTADGPIVLPPGTCSMTMQYYITGFSVCDGELCSPELFEIVSGGEYAELRAANECDLLLTVKLLPGSNEIVIEGSGTTLTLTADVVDTTIPVITTSSGLDFTIPACAQTITRNIVFQLDDACGFGILNVEDAGAGLGDEAFTLEDLVLVEPLELGIYSALVSGQLIFEVELSIEDDGKLLTAFVIDESGNLGTFSAPISVSNAVEDGDPIIIAADATVFVPACVPSIPFTYSLQIIDDCQDFDPDGFSVSPDLTALGLTVDVMETGMVRVSGPLPAGTYNITYTYDNGVVSVDKSVVVQANSVANEAPEIIVPGNQTVTLPACVASVPTSWAFQISDDCSDIVAEELSITIGEDEVPFTLSGGIAVISPTISLDANGVTVSATYSDGTLSTTASFVLTVLQAEDTQDPVVVYPSQDITLVLDACDAGPATQIFQVTAFDNCGVDGLTVTSSGGSLVNVPNTSVYIFSGAGDMDGEVYTISITATDVNGNTTNESFNITVQQDDAEEFSVACQGSISVSLDGNCDALITPQMVLAGEFGCVDPLTDLKITVLDGNQSNGNIVDGCGDFMYRVEPVINQPLEIAGLNGFLAPANWFEISNTGSVTFGAGTITINSGSVGIFAAAQTATFLDLPVAGDLSFDYDYDGSDPGFDFFIYAIDANTGTFETLFESTTAATGTANIAVEPGNVLGVGIVSSDFLFASEVVLSNFSFTSAEALFANPLLNGFQGCMGMVSSKDLTLPTVDAPDNTDVNAGNNFPLYCNQTEDLSVVGIPLADRCYVVTALGVDLPASNSQSINHPSKRALRDILQITGFPEARDNCGQVQICVSDAVVNDDMCEDYQILRTFRATDGFNSTCDASGTVQSTQTITFSRPTLGDLDLPTTPFELDCGDDFATLANGNPAPSASGFPTLSTGLGVINIGDGTSAPVFCNIGATFEDGPRITTCDGSFKFLRTWTLFDWCGPDGVAITDSYEQLIKVGDFNAPSISYNGPTMFSTNAFGCTSVFIVPTPTTSDNCSSAVTTVAYVYAFGNLTSAPFGPYTPGSISDALPKGTHTLQYVSTDVCGNEARLNVEIMIADKSAPVAKCDDDFNASLGGAGNAWFSAEEIDAGSYDECTDVRLEVRRSIANFATAPGPGAGPNPTQNNLFTIWGPTVSFNCNDADRYVRVELRVWDDGNMNGIIGDAGDNWNTCWLDLLIENKLPPVCVAPAPVTVLCTDLDPNFPNDVAAAYDEDPEGVSILLGDLFGYAAAAGNCGAEVVELRPIDGRDDCGFGVITRRFEASATTSTSAGNLTSSCNQQVRVLEVHEYDIKFPMDDSFDCNVDPVGPTVETYEIGCDLLSIYRDTMRFQATGDECYKLRKTIQIINWCEYDGIGDPYVLSRDEDNDGIAGEMFWVAVEGDRAFVRRNRETGLLREIAGYANSSSRGYFEYVQFLKVYDNVAPTIDVITEDLEFCSVAAVPACDGDVTIEFTVDDACTPDATQMLVNVALDAFVTDNNGDGTITLAEFTADSPLTVSNTDGVLSVSGTFPIGRHAIRISVEDGCGNYAAQIVIFEVVDCKAPAPICINGLTVTLMPDGNGGGMMSIWASDFLASPIDDCSGIVGYAIYRAADVIAEGDDFVADPADTGLTLTCDDDENLAVRIYAIDGAGNFDYCETSLLVQANTPGLCAPGGSIAGVIATEANESVEGVEVSLTGNNAMTFTTGENGAFVFDNLELGMDYTVTPYLDNNHKNGVSTFDLVLIQKHILGIQPLGSPYKVIAADANGNKDVSTLDLVQLRRLILNITTELPSNTSWRFVEADYEFSNLSNPWADDFPEIFNANDLAGDISANFIAIKIGDVNFSATANAQSAGEARGVGYFNFEVANTELLAGNVYTVEFTGAELANMAGFQGTLQLGQGVSLVDVVYGVATEANFGLTAADRGAISFSWDGEATAEDVLFSLVVRAETDANLSDVLNVTSRYTTAEAYTLGGAKRNVGINFTTGEVVAAGFELYQNRPNPVAGETTIGFNLPTAGQVTLTIQDVTGKVILNRTEERSAGYNNLVLNRRELGVSGVLTYTVTAGDYTATKKMVIVD